MGKPRLVRPWLESLSTPELAGIAASEGLDVSPGLERVFLIEDLLELARDREEEDALAAFPAPADAVPLPKQYNITWLDVLIRDPLWAFAFWEIKSSKREALENAPGFGGYVLAVFPVDPAESPGQGGEAEPSFIVNVGVEDFSWYLGFPPAVDRGGASHFRVELACGLGGGREVLAHAGPFRLPALLPAEGALYGEQKLFRLSGLDEMPVLRNGDRVSKYQMTGPLPQNVRRSFQERP